MSEPESETLVVPPPAEELAMAEALDSAGAAVLDAREDPPKPQPKTVEEKAGLVDGVRYAAKYHAQSSAKRIRLEVELLNARTEEAQALEALHAARRTLKLEAEATE